VTVLPLVSRAYLSAEGMNHELQAIADAQHRQSKTEHALVRDRSVRVVHGAGTARENYSYGRVAADLFQGGVTREDDRKDVLFTDAARDKLRILGAEVEDDDGLVFHERVSQNG
jgi:hypothetical protein